jgi:hypothetical protein
MTGPADAGDKVEAVQEVFKQVSQALLDQKGLSWIMVVTGELAEGEVYECRIRFGFTNPQPGDQATPWVDRPRRINGNGRRPTIWTPRGGMLG